MAQVTADICPHIMEGKCPFIEYPDANQVPTVGPDGIGVVPATPVEEFDSKDFYVGRNSGAVRYYTTTGGSGSGGSGSGGEQATQ